MLSHCPMPNADANFETKKRERREPRGGGGTSYTAFLPDEGMSSTDLYPIFIALSWWVF